LDRFLETHKPDVMFLSENDYDRLAQSGKLFELDTVIEQDRFELEGIHPAILKRLREPGGGKLYGLSPEFASSGLYYNIDLFQKHGVEFPRDSMTWDEVFELAKRFPTDGDEDSKIYGLTVDYYRNIGNLIRTIGAGQNLRMLNEDGTTVVSDTESWRKVFASVIESAKTGSLYVPREEERSLTFSSLDAMYEQNPFVMGRSAMAYKGSYGRRGFLEAGFRTCQQYFV